MRALTIVDPPAGESPSRLLATLLLSALSASMDVQGESSSPVTFNKEIAPIIFEQCASCHRPGQSGPFNLLSYEDVRRRAREIGEVTLRRFMPPWLPEPGHGEFLGDRTLTANQIELIQRWIAQGVVEGRPEDLPARPIWRDEWQLGHPDLVVHAPEAYTLRAEGRDVYRNLVLKIPIDVRRYVKGVEFRPGNKVVHHAFVNVDNTGQSRRLAAKETPAGFDGMDLPDTAHMPGGQLLGWQPGKVPSFSPPGLAWVLEKGTDLVLQLHLRPTGKPELVQPQVGFYFTDQPPTNVAYRLQLQHYKIDIPPGVSDYRVQEHYEIPVDATLMRILPHAHYLGKEMRVFATLPNGTRKWLLYIRRWDPAWQGDYGYKAPVELPKGSRITMDYVFDNSAANPRNPHEPPRRVTYGLQTTDEMATCSFQAVTKTTAERDKLAEHFYLYYSQISLDYNQHILAQQPTNALAHVKAARALLALGNIEKAQQHLGQSIRLKPDLDKAYYDLGSIWLRQNRLVEAEKAFKAVVKFNPDDSEAFGNLGVICLRQGKINEAQTNFTSALRLNPDDEIARRNLEAITRHKATQPSK